MKKLLVVLFALPVMANAQSLIGGKNIIKANLSSLALRNYHFIYERSLAAKGRVTLSLGYRTMSKGSLPFQSNIESLFNNDPNLNFGRVQIGGYAITPEVRFYAKNMKGFYLAPYARYANMDVTLPIKYSTTVSGVPVKKDADALGRITSLSGGLMIGLQKQLLKKLVLDIWIVGAHFGSGKGDLVATYNSFQDANSLVQTAGQQQERQSLQKAIDDLNVDPFKISGTVTQANSTTGRADIKVDGPWLGVRALGLTVGVRF
jgi:hypothetical protein